MASVEECETALRRLGEMLGSADAGTVRKHVLDRSIACRVRDLDTTFRGELKNGQLHDIRTGEADGAQIKLQVSSDDLIALTAGRLSFPVAWATGRLKIDASISDLLKLRALL